MSHSYIKPSVTSHCSQRKTQAPQQATKPGMFWILPPALLSTLLIMHRWPPFCSWDTTSSFTPISLASAVPSAKRAILHTPCINGLFSSFQSSLAAPSSHLLSLSVSQSNMHIKTIWQMKHLEKANL